MAHINWDSVYTFFIVSESTTLADTAKHFNIHVDYVRQVASKQGWTTKKLQIQQTAQKLIENKVVEQIAKRNEEHIKQARLLQGTALEAIAEKGLRPESFDIARKALETGQKLERAAMNMDRRETPSVAVQNNFNSFNAQHKEGQPFQIQWGDGEDLGTFVHINGHLERIETNKDAY